jgi:uncharacterized protein (DUF2147 family)
MLAAGLLAWPCSAAQPVTGHWLTDDKDGIIEIAPCGGKMCGRIVRSLKQVSGPLVDRNNPDPGLRTRPVLGLTVLPDFVRDGDVWRGRIYDPRRGRFYRATLERIGADRLKVHGCVSVLCRTITWRRVPKPAA